MESVDWEAVEATEPGGTTEDGVTVSTGDALEQFLEWFDAQGLASRRDRMLEAQHALVHGRSAASTLTCPSSGSRYCHPAHSTVQLENGAAKRMDKLAVGDVIRTPSGFEPVVGFLHKEVDTYAQFFVFETVDTTVAISEKHWLFVDGVEADPATVTVGQMLTTPEGAQPVIAVRKERHLGAYHLITPSGAYYVDGVAASTYPAYIPHAAWKLVGDAYVTMRYRLGLPVVPEGEAPVTLFWLLDGLRAAGISDATASTFFWPFIAASVIATEVGSAVTAAAAAKAAPLGALALVLAATPLAHKARAA